VGGTGTARDGHTGRNKLTPAQMYCLAIGATLLLVGLLGFIADATFDTAASGVDSEGGNANGNLQGDSFLGFEVNGWHNIVHILSGVFLLASFRKRAAAKGAATAFGVVYLIVAIIGLIDGNDVLGFIPVNGADNVLHLVLGALGIASGLASKATYDDHRDGANHGTHGTESTTSGTRTSVR
jgi:multisubunit Na+/H+ antiporter MnhG subunit